MNSIFIKPLKTGEWMEINLSVTFEFTFFYNKHGYSFKKEGKK